MASKKKAVTKAGASRPSSAAMKALKTSARKVKRPTVSAAVVKARPARPAPAPLPDRLRIGVFSAKFGGVFVGRFPGGKDRPDYNLFAPNDPTALTFKAAFGPTAMIDGADSDTDGMANTMAMLKAGSPIAKFARRLKAHGRTDFYIAAPREARVVAAVAPELYNSTGYRWTSKQLRVWTDRAVVQDFSDGFQFNIVKSYVREAVLVRREPIQ